MELGQQHPQVGVVLLSQESHVELASSLLERGASGRGYLLKDRVHDLRHLVDTILAVAAGECRVDPTLITMLVQRPVGRSSPLDALTPRQEEILADIAEGLSNKAIADRRVLTQRAVEKHASEIFQRLGIQDVLYAGDDGQGWMTAEGVMADPPLAADRALTPAHLDGRRVAGLVHDRSMSDEPALLSAVLSTTAIALDTNRPQAQLHAMPERIDAARSRIERDRHDGAQQRLIALRTPVRHVGSAAMVGICITRRQLGS